mmetsp:Transcript_19716/g.39243  ORF Transcript_19716/g.39243 Transcript_19716/m.39243 type:complete len:263 (+) Transcript_19716:115-903(+)
MIRKVLLLLYHHRFLIRGFRMVTCAVASDASQLKIKSVFCSSYRIGRELVPEVCNALDLQHLPTHLRGSTRLEVKGVEYFLGAQTGPNKVTSVIRIELLGTFLCTICLPNAHVYDLVPLESLPSPLHPDGHQPDESPDGPRSSLHNNHGHGWICTLYNTPRQSVLLRVQVHLGSVIPVGHINHVKNGDVDPRGRIFRKLPCLTLLPCFGPERPLSVHLLMFHLSLLHLSKGNRLHPRGVKYSLVPENFDEIAEGKTWLRRGH